MRASGIARVLLFLLLGAGSASAQAINTNVALPVAEGEGIWRTQLRYSRASDDPGDRSRRTLLAPQTLVVGFTPRITGFATLPLRLSHRVERSGERVAGGEAFGDITLLLRGMVYVDDYAPLSTRRLALLAGLKLPTGADRFGTASFDPVLGWVGTWIADRHGASVDLLWASTTERHDSEAGDRLRYDLAYRYRLWPARFGRRAVALHGVLELNGSWTGHTRAGGRFLRDSGGHELLLAPGVQFLTRRFLVEASFQLPVLQRLTGRQLERDYVAILSLRIPFAIW